MLGRNALGSLMRGHSLAVAALFAALATGVLSDDAATGATAAADTAEAPSTESSETACPLNGGGFNERHVLAQVLVQQGESMQQAEKCLREAVGMTLPALRMLSRLLASRGELREASVYSAALEVLEPIGDNMWMHADMLARMNETDKALPRYEALLSANTENAKLWNAYGVTLASHGKVAEAVTALGKAVAMDGSNEKYRNNLERVQAKSGAGTATPGTEQAAVGANGPA